MMAVESPFRNALATDTAPIRLTRREVWNKSNSATSPTMWTALRRDPATTVRSKKRGSNSHRRREAEGGHISQLSSGVTVGDQGISKTRITLNLNYSEILTFVQ